MFFGPDENTADLMDVGALLARTRGYKYWKAMTTGKSVRLGGIPHDTYGMTTNSVHQVVLGLLEKEKLKEEEVTKVMTGGPDGDLGSNEILISKDKTVCIIDGSGVVFDPNGLNREELTRLARGRLTISHFSRSFLSKDGFMVPITEEGQITYQSYTWRTATTLRDTFILCPLCKADLFVPCGGRPATINMG